MKCAHCTKYIPTARLYRLLVLDPSGETKLDFPVHEKCYRKMAEIHLMPLPDKVIISKIRWKEKQRVPLVPADQNSG